MSVTPQEILNTILKTEENLIPKLEQKIDNTLWKEYNGEKPVNIWFASDTFKILTSARVLSIIRKRYPNWFIAFAWSKEPCDNGGYLEFTAK